MLAPFSFVPSLVPSFQAFSYCHTLDPTIRVLSLGIPASPARILTVRFTANLNVLYSCRASSNSGYPLLRALATVSS